MDFFKMPQLQLKGDNCLVCDRYVSEYDPMMCCNSQGCSCMGLPLRLCLCSKKCLTDLMQIENESRKKVESYL